MSFAQTIEKSCLHILLVEQEVSDNQEHGQKWAKIAQMENYCQIGT